MKACWTTQASNSSSIRSTIPPKAAASYGSREKDDGRTLLLLTSEHASQKAMPAFAVAISGKACVYDRGRPGTVWPRFQHQPTRGQPAHVCFRERTSQIEWTTTSNNWFLKVDTPFWPEAFLYIGRAIDLARVGYALHQFVLAPARVCFGRCRLCCWRQARRNGLLWLTDPAHTGDACAALLDGNEATVCAAANVVNCTPSIGVRRGSIDQH
jgi:hypothetical protein